MVVDRPRRSWSHHVFREIPRFLQPGDLLILNDTRVIQARLEGRTGTGKRLELLLLREVAQGIWDALVKPGKHAPPGTELDFSPDLRGRILERGAYGKRKVELETSGDLGEILGRIGRTPLPPYIKRLAGKEEPFDRERYQTIFARRPGSVAAPTAGLHFTSGILEHLQRNGIQVEEITLRVGYGTFQPVRVEEVERHRMETEPYEIPHRAAAAIEESRKSGRRVIAVGTTTTRALEDRALKCGGRIEPGRGEADLFIRPGFQFQVVEGLLTNFHLPRSTLLMLVCAFAGRDLVLDCYRDAVARQYRFYSYGDCMLILP